MEWRTVHQGPAVMTNAPPRGPKADARNFNAGTNARVDPITQNLRRIYDEVAAEPLPDDLKRLLAELESLCDRDPDA